MSNRIYFGLDAGGSKISAVGSLGSQRFEGQFPSANARKEQPEQTALRLFNTVQAVCSSMDVDALKSEIRLCAGIAGAADPDLQQAIQTRVAHLFSAPHQSFRIVSDARIAFEAAFNVGPVAIEDGSKILVIAGTGSGCYSFSDSEEFFRAGGWGTLLGDPGSGTALGLAAIRQVLSAVELHQSSTFVSRVLDLLKPYWKPSSASKADFGSISSILQVVYNPDFKPALLAPVVLELGSRPGSAFTILKNETVQLADQIVRLAEHIGTEKGPLSIALAGGLLQNDLYQATLSNAILNRLPSAHLIIPKAEPVEGALLLAQKMS